MVDLVIEVVVVAAAMEIVVDPVSHIIFVIAMVIRHQIVGIDMILITLMAEVFSISLLMAILVLSFSLGTNFSLGLLLHLVQDNLLG